MVSRIASPNVDDWCKWIRNDDSGENAQSIDGDDDGFFTQRNQILIDLPHALSRTLGRQMSSMSTYEIDYIRVELLNFDDTNDGSDNESALSVSGNIYHYSPTKHRIDALQLARQLEKHNESSQFDEDSFLLSSERDYQGMRFNWDADSQVKYATKESFGQLAGTEYDLAELFDVYGNMQDQSLLYANSLWPRRTGFANSQGFECSYSNYTANSADNHYDPKSLAYEFDKPLSALCGLFLIDFTHSSVASTLNLIDDDYLVQVTVGVRGWSDF